MAVILDIVQIIYTCMSIGTKRLEIETKLLWGANIMSHINLQMAILNLTVMTFQCQNAPTTALMVNCSCELG